MASRRTPRQIAFDSWSEKRDFQPEVEHLITSMGGRYMHANEATVRKGRTVTPTNVPWPDLTIWFPGSDDPRYEGSAGLHLVELKSHAHPKPRGGQPELFASLDAAGIDVLVWEPRDLDVAIPWTLHHWSGRDLPANRYPYGLSCPGTPYVPRALRLQRTLKEASAA